MDDPGPAGGAETPAAFRSGFVAVVGRPNTGKSTLINALVGEKVSITSNKPQTTRHTIRGVLTTDEGQAVFIDTPGYHKPKTQLGKRLNAVAREAAGDIDVGVLVVDGKSGIGRGDERAASDLLTSGARTICAVNKIDLMSKNSIAVALDAASRLGDFAHFVPISAYRGANIDLLASLVIEMLPEGPELFPRDMTTDQEVPKMISELVREKLLAITREELPHSIAVVTQEIEDRGDGLSYIDVVIFVERESQKGIVVGKGGTVLKKVGTEARTEIEEMLGRKVFLDLRVKVEADWQSHDEALDRFGFGG